MLGVISPSFTYVKNRRNLNRYRKADIIKNWEGGIGEHCSTDSALSCCMGIGHARHRQGYPQEHY